MVRILQEPWICVFIYTTPPQNVLTRRGDIELANFNEPTQPLQAYFQDVDSNVISNSPLSSNDLGSFEYIHFGHVNYNYPEVFFNNYTELERYLINSTFENEIIFYKYFIIFLIIYLIFILLKILIDN